MKISEFLQNLISEGMKQKDIAEKCGYSAPHINRIIKSGKAELVTIEKIARAFNKPVSIFLEDEKEILIPTDREELLLQQIREEGLLDEALRWVEKEKLYKNVKKENAA